MEKFTLREIKTAMLGEGIGEASIRYTLDKLKKSRIPELAELLKGKLSDPTADCMEIAKAFVDRSLDSEAIVRLAHGNNMNVVYNILNDFNLEMYV